MSIAHTIARPYAKAIFETALQNNLIEEWKEILIFINMITSNHKVKNFLSGSLSPKFLSSVFIKISSDLIHKNAKNLIKLLAENQRFQMLNDILKQFLKLEACHKKIVIVELRTALILKEKQTTKIRKILEKSFSRKIKFINVVDDYILDGIIIKVNNTVFDLSARNHLKQLSKALNF